MRKCHFDYVIWIVCPFGGPISETRPKAVYRLCVAHIFQHAVERLAGDWERCIGLRLLAQYFDCSLAKWHRVFPAALHSRTGDCPRGAIDVELSPARANDLTKARGR